MSWLHRLLKRPTRDPDLLATHVGCLVRLQFRDGEVAENVMYGLGGVPMVGGRQIPTIVLSDSIDGMSPVVSYRKSNIVEWTCVQPDRSAYAHYEQGASPNVIGGSR